MTVALRPHAIMDFYKKIVKSKDPASILSEKEYKCVSLQAITNEAVKENNKRTLRELVDEINGHLSDLRAIKDDKDAKIKEKCASLIQTFEECLLKIVNTNTSTFDELSAINGQLQELQNLTNLAIKDNNLEQLKKVAERMERNVAIVKEIPEVKSARSSEDGGERILEVVNKYTSLLNKVLAHINAHTPQISGPTQLETTHENIQELETPLPTPNKIALNEVEEKLKLMRQKRLNRLSTFVDQQTKLAAEKRSRENSPKNSTINSNKSSEILSQVPESVEHETLVRSSEMMKPSSYKAAAREKFVKVVEQRMMIPKNEEKHLMVQQEKMQGGSVSALRSSFGKGGLLDGSNDKMVGLAAPTAGKPQEKPYLQMRPDERKSAPSEEGKAIKSNTEVTNRKETVEPSKGTQAVRTNSFGKTNTTRSFAERQIEYARNLTEKPKVALKSSNSTKTTPPRTPTQIRKIFNSFNVCVSGSSNSKSIEDLPSEFNSPFEQQLKTVQLRSTGLSTRLEGFKTSENSETRTEFSGKTVQANNPAGWSRRSGSFKERDGSDAVSHETTERKELPPPPIPWRKNKPPLEKPVVYARNIKPNQEHVEYAEVKFEEKPNAKLTRVGVIEKSVSQGQINLPSISTNKDQGPQEDAMTKNKSWRSSFDYDTVMMRQHNETADLIKPEPTDFTITIKRDSNNTPEPPPERCSFTTFRTSTDSVKNENAVENPLYGMVTNQTKQNPATTTKLSRQSSISVDSLLLLAKAKELHHFDFGDSRKRVRKSSYRREQSNDDDRFVDFKPVITKLEYVIAAFMGLKRDEDYASIDRLLSKYYVRVDDIPADSALDSIEKSSLLQRLTQASRDLERRVIKNEKLLRLVLEEQVEMMAEKYNISV